MISKKNSALIFDPKFTFPFKKHEIFGAVVHVSHMTACEFFFFRTLRRSKGCDFHEKNIHKNLFLMINQQLIDLLFWATKLEARAPQLKMLAWGAQRAP